MTSSANACQISCQADEATIQTRITTKYNIPNLDSPEYTKPKKRKRDVEVDGAAPAAKVPRAWLTLKTYDPESGVVLKFKTDRAAEVGRLINGLGRLGRHMAALPQRTEGRASIMLSSSHGPGLQLDLQTQL